MQSRLSGQATTASACCRPNLAALHGGRAFLSQKEQRPGNEDPQSPAVWLDGSGEWQVQGVIRHDEGNLRLDGDGLQIIRAGRRGWLRQTPWEESHTIPLETLKSLKVVSRGRKRSILDLELRSEALTKSNGAITLRNCRPAAGLRALVEQIQAHNRALTVEWPNPAGA